MAFAERTGVPVERTKGEVEKLLVKYGADQFGIASHPGAAVVIFRLRNRFIRIKVPMPPGPKADATVASRQTYEQLMRTRWRCVLLTIKAKLEAVDVGVETFEQAFMAHVLMPDNKVLGDHVLPAIEHAYQSGKMPKLLPGF